MRGIESKMSATQGIADVRCPNTIVCSRPICRFVVADNSKLTGAEQNAVPHNQRRWVRWLDA